MNFDEFKTNQSSVGAACKVSPNWSQEAMTCHSSNFFSIALGQGNAPLVTSPRPNLESAQIYVSPEFM